MVNVKMNNNVDLVSLNFILINLLSVQKELLFIIRDKVIGTLSLILHWIQFVINVGLHLNKLAIHPVLVFIYFFTSVYCNKIMMRTNILHTQLSESKHITRLQTIVLLCNLLVWISINLKKLTLHKLIL